jgi:hypothetical protein
MTILGNVNEAHKGRTVRALATGHKCTGPDFPGWGDPDYAAHLRPIAEGVTGTITSVESHGAAPYTRYTVAFADGTRASGLVLGTDVEFAAGQS